MNTEIKDSIFSLLYAMVLIDKRVVKVEMDTFFARIEGFLGLIEDVESLRAKDIIANWFVQNYKNVLREMKTPNREQFMLTHVGKLKTYMHREQVFHIMQIIAHADEEFHDDEKAFLDDVAQIWGISESYESMTEVWDMRPL